MTDFLKPISQTRLTGGFAKVDRHEYDFRRANGTWQRQVRETIDIGDGAAVLLCDIAAGEVVLTRQFRYPVYCRGEPAMLIEACAGKLDGDDPETCVRREALEETGYRLGEVTKVCDCYVSPGALTERVTCFIGLIEGEAETRGGGLENEGEDIEVLRLPFATVKHMLPSGEIADAKTILLIQYAELSRLFG